MYSQLTQLAKLPQADSHKQNRQSQAKSVPGRLRTNIGIISICSGNLYITFGQPSHEVGLSYKIATQSTQFAAKTLKLPLLIQFLSLTKFLYISAVYKDNRCHVVFHRETAFKICLNTGQLLKVLPREICNFSNTCWPIIAEVKLPSKHSF